MRTGAARAGAHRHIEHGFTMLFRTEAMTHARRDHTEGQLLVHHPGLLLACAVTALAAACAIAVLLFATRHTPSIRLEGRLGDDGQVRFQAPAGALPTILPGQRIALRYPALPSPAGTTGHGIVQAVTATAGARAGAASAHAILVVSDAGGPHPARQPGTVVQADLALPAMRMIDWIVGGRQ